MKKQDPLEEFIGMIKANTNFLDKITGKPKLWNIIFLVILLGVIFVSFASMIGVLGFGPYGIGMRTIFSIILVPSLILAMVLFVKIGYKLEE